MATNSVQAKWNRAEEEDDEEEEALSLCDLPVTLINHKEQQENQQRSQINEATQEEFDFRSWGGLFSKESEMCVADEVFFKGQILPLRLSFSSEAGLLTTPSQHRGKQFINESRSESLDHGSVSDFQSNNSSRSSSVRSQNSSSSTSSTTTITTVTPPRIRNQFHTHPSPKPQLRVSTPRQLASQGRKSSSAWEIFRLGVVPAPEIGLQDLKVRNSANKNCVSRNSSSNSSSNSVSNAKSVKTNNKGHHGNKSNHVLKQLVGKGGGLLSGCDCSFETVQSNTVMIKSANKTESTTHALKDKVVELKKQKHKQKQGKKVMSRRRTFEWLKELHANASNIDEEALLSNP
ncbi:uncharacterized protein LOC113859029 [Abrus precatorius]|uniref:Uncharacterized protein LOC113859029 n=1 Tax=Abrus precatorius TaxID=3816 RepID=A0A8B8KUP2_ABRPR|nr:uncharacterized protein LOC113859029 [Abrus precatorius]